MVYVCVASESIHQYLVSYGALVDMDVKIKGLGGEIAYIGYKRNALLSIYTNVTNFIV